MKIYYTTSTITDGDYSYYGIFAEDGGKYYRYTDLGEWEVVDKEHQIEYYKTCQKVDLEEYMAEKNQPEALKLFQRKSPRERKSGLVSYIPNPDGIIGIVPAPKHDMSYVAEPVVALCQLPDGGYLLYQQRETGFEGVMNKKLGRLKVLSRKYIEDGNYTITETDTKAIPSDIFEDEVVLPLDEKLNPEIENY